MRHRIVLVAAAGLLIAMPACSAPSTPAADRGGAVRVR